MKTQENISINLRLSSIFHPSTRAFLGYFEPSQAAPRVVPPSPSTLPLPARILPIFSQTRLKNYIIFTPHSARSRLETISVNEQDPSNCAGPPRGCGPLKINANPLHLNCLSFSGLATPNGSAVLHRSMFSLFLIHVLCIHSVLVADDVY